jgi:uncharacterized membrane protein
MSTPAGSDNPFAPPRAALQADEALDGEYLPAGRRRPAGNGATRVSEGWRLFLRAPLSWVLVTVVFCGLYVVVSLVPIVGWMVDNVLVPVLLGGLMLGCQRIERGEAFSVSDLFSGFTHRAGPLMLLGLLYLLASVLIFVVVLVFFGATMMPYFLPGLTHATPPAIPDLRLLLLAVLVMLALTIPLYMAIWFAPALVVFHDVKPAAAMRASFGACARNFVPFLVYGVVTFVIAIVATIPLGLGWLAFMPVLWASEYAGYRDIYIEA